MSEFVLSSALREAENALADQRVFRVSDENWSNFMAILGAQANAGVRGESRRHIGNITGTDLVGGNGMAKINTH